MGIINLINLIEIRDIIDIALVAIVVYKLVQLIRDTRAMQLVKGILFLVLATQLSEWLGLNTLYYILENAMTLGVIAIVVVFQPELRRALEQLGRGTFFEDILSSDDMERELKVKNAIDEVCEAASDLSMGRIGALMIIERQTKIGDIIRSGIQMDSLVSYALLRNIFIPNTPLHDGAVVIRMDRIVASACLLPLTDNLGISKELGTRHRAALGISENSDCIAIVVSEETGVISLAVNGNLTRNLNKELLNKILTNYLIKKMKKEKSYKNSIMSKIPLRKDRKQND